MAEITVILDDVLLERIDQAAAAEGLTRGAYLARALERVLDSEADRTSIERDEGVERSATTVSRSPEMQSALDELRETLRRYRTSEERIFDPATADEQQLGPGPGANPAVWRALDRARELLANTPSGDSTAIIRAERDARAEHVAQMAGPMTQISEIALERLRKIAEARHSTGEIEGRNESNSR